MLRRKSAPKTEPFWRISWPDFHTTAFLTQLGAEKGDIMTQSGSSSTKGRNKSYSICIPILLCSLNKKPSFHSSLTLQTRPLLLLSKRKHLIHLQFILFQLTSQVSIPSSSHHAPSLPSLNFVWRLQQGWDLLIPSLNGALMPMGVGASKSLQGSSYQLLWRHPTPQPSNLADLLPPGWGRCI